MGLTPGAQAGRKWPGQREAPGEDAARCSQLFREGVNSRVGGFPREPGRSLPALSKAPSGTRGAERTGPETRGGRRAGCRAGGHPRHAVPEPGREEGGSLLGRLRTGHWTRG